MRNKHKIYVLFAFFLIFTIFSNLNQNSSLESYGTIFQERTDEIINEPYQDLPQSSVLDKFQRSNPFYIIDYPFEDTTDIDDWIATGTVDVENVGAGVYKMVMTGDLGGGTDCTVEYNLPFYTFIGTNVSFEYDNAGGSSRTLAFQVYDDVGGEGWHTVWQNTSTGAGVAYIDISNRNTNDAIFSFRFTFAGSSALASAEIDNLKIGTYEFNVLELGDPVPSYNNQWFSMQVCPDFADWNALSIEFKINDSDLSSGTEIVSVSPLLQNFTAQIWEENYTARDTVYYKIVAGSSTASDRESSVFSYSVSDITNPDVPIYNGGNQSSALYYQDVELLFNMSDDLDGLGLDYVALYIANDTINPGPADVTILSNYSVVPLNGGIFSFLIPSVYLSADHTLHYRAYARDTSNNERYTSDASFNIGDDIKPNISLNTVYASANGIENNESLVVSYDVAEHADGIGLDNVSLFVKVTTGPSPPSNGVDFDFSINPDGGIPDEDGGLFTFTINEGNYSYGDYIYFWANATDSESPIGNINSTFSTYQTVFSNDTYSPYVINTSTNGDDAIYNVSKVLDFTITEPVGASGIKTNSIELSYELNNWDGTGRDTLISTLPLTGGSIQFVIGEGNYSYNDIVYYQLNVSDNANNNYSSVVGSFYVSDPYSPIVNLLSYNNTQPEYADDFNITFSVSEDLEASQLLSVDFFVYNNTGGAIPIKIYDFNTTLTGIGGDIRFTINSSITYSRYELNWSLVAIDNANNMNNYTGQIVIHDNINSSVLYQYNNGTTDNYEYDEHAAVYYLISEPIQGSGFYSDGTGLKLYYKQGVSTNPNDFDGSVDVFNATVNAYGGLYMFIIPESFTEYGWIIEYWVNISDKQGNVNSTWSDSNNNITIVDTTDPIIVMDNAFNELDHSYHLDKLIRFTPTEFVDSSRLKNATIYWKKNGDPLVNPDGSYDITSNITVGGIGGVLYYWTIYKIDAMFNYSAVISFIVEVYDQAGNGFNSSVNSFTIIDLVDPDYTEGAENTIDYTWRTNKTLIFTINDPDYDNSSGIDLIELYFKYESAPTVGVYDGKLVNNTPSLAIDTYYFIVELDEWNFTNVGPNLYYFIRIYDVHGNYKDSIVQSFFMHNDAYRSDNIQGPSLFQWLPSGNVHFYVEAHLITDINVFINGTFHSNYYSNVFNGYIDLIAAGYGEGLFGVEFKFLGNVSVKAFNFSVDLYAPSKVPDFTFNIFGTGVVELLWDKPTGTDAFTVYRIYRSTDKNNIITAENLFIELSESNLLDEVSLGTDSYSDATVVTGATYYYVIVAVDRVGHVSPASDIMTVIIPGEFTIYIILFIVIGAVAAVSVFAISKSRTSKRRKMLFSQVDMKKLDFDEETLISEQVITKKQPEWTKIETKAVSKTVVDGFEFDGVPATTITTVTDIKTYQSHTIGKLLSRAAKFEIKEEYGKVMKIYSIILRIAKRTSNSLLIMSIEAKIDEIYKRNSE